MSARSLSLALTLGFAFIALSASSAEAKQHRFVGGHPIAPKAGDGYCYIEAPHVHVYSPHRAKILYRQHEGDHYFVGDPVAHDYDGPKHNYYGHHPIHVDRLIDDHDEDDHVYYCYLDGPHYHTYRPPLGVTFTAKGDAYWYIGEMPPAYKKHRRRYSPINAYYKPVTYVRPVVTVEPPVGYVGAVVDVHPVAGVEVHGPAAVISGPGVHAEVRAGVEIHVPPPPTLEIGVSLPGVVVVDDHRHGYVGHRHGKHKKYKRHGKHKKYKRYGKHKKYKRRGTVQRRGKVKRRRGKRGKKVWGW